jgi:hypothetical protein
MPNFLQKFLWLERHLADCDYLAHPAGQKMVAKLDELRTKLTDEERAWLKARNNLRHHF